MINRRYYLLTWNHKPRGGKAFWTLIVLIAILGVLTACNTKPISPESPETVGNPEAQDESLSAEHPAVKAMAEEYMANDIAHYETNPDVEIVDNKITRLELVGQFDNLAETPIFIFALEYRLLPKDLSKVVLAGGMQVDEHGWLKETSSAGSPMLAVSYENGEAKLLGVLTTLGVQEEVV